MFYTQIIRKIITFMIFAILAAALPFRASSAPPQLPPDESGLAALIEDQLIDSIQYDMLTMFYALPLSVPQGELAQLVMVFSDIGDLLPTLEQLEAYKPFDNRMIQKLFIDFPVLADMEPILRFNVLERRQAQAVSGEIIFGINKSSVNELKGHRARFHAKSRHISAEGTVNLNDTGAMWQSRRVDFSYSQTAAQIGNFKQPIPGELFWGRFARLELENDEDEIAANWLYGGSNTWNGVAVNTYNIMNIATIGASAFYHQRGTSEKAAGGAVDLKIGKKMRINTGVTEVEATENVNVNNDAIDTYDADDNIDDDPAANEDTPLSIAKIHTAHLYGEYKDNTWRIVAETGMPFTEKTASIPAFAFCANYRIKGSTAEYQYIAYPQNFHAPMSRIKRQLLSETGIKESSGAPAVQKHRLKMTVPLDIPLIDMARFVPELDFTELEGTVRRIHVRTDIKARIDKADITLKHTSRIFTMSTDSALNTSSAALKLQTDYPLEIHATAQSTYGYYKNSRNSYTFELYYSGLPNMTITPFVRGKYVTDHQYWLGLKSELHLYKKTLTSVTAELPVNVKGAENVFIKGSASYTF